MVYALFEQRDDGKKGLSVVFIGHCEDDWQSRLALYVCSNKENPNVKKNDYSLVMSFLAEHKFIPCNDRMFYFDEK